MEKLTEDICKEYAERGSHLKTGPEDVGARKQLKEELMKAFKIPEAWALNIVNGRHIKEYCILSDYLATKAANKKGHNDEEKQKFLEWQADQLEMSRLAQLIQTDSNN